MPRCLSIHACCDIHRLICRTLCFSLALVQLALVSYADDAGLRVRLGLNDNRPTEWNGKVEVSPGRVTHISGWRFNKDDAINGTEGWTASTHPLALQARGNNKGKAKAAAKQRADQPMADNGVVISMTDVTDASKVSIQTAHGTVDLTLGEIKYGEIVTKLDGAIEIERSAAAVPLTTAATDDDYPATAIAADGTTYVAHVTFTHGDRTKYHTFEDSNTDTSFANSGKGWKKAPDDFSFLKDPVGGDQIVLRYQRKGTWSEEIPVTSGGGDIYKCSIAVDEQGTAWICWSENINYPQPNANFEIFIRSYANGKLGPAIKLSNNEASDVNPVLATSSSGDVWCAWQAVRDGAFRIVERHQTSSETWTDERPVSTQKRNCWTPSIANSSDGRIAIGWDTYEKGDYDIWVREFAKDGTPLTPRAAADTVDYEARPALAYDKQNALWIAYELGSPSWGKDSGPYDNGGNPLYRGRQIGLIVLKGDAWMEPTESYLEKLPNVAARRRVNNQRVAPIEPQGESPEQARLAELWRDAAYNNLARIACDKSGYVWIICRSRQNDFRFPLVGSLWLNWAICYDGQKWTGPILIPNSDNLMYNSPAVAAMPQGGLFVAHSSDHRQDRFETYDEFKREARNAEDPFDNDVYATWLKSPAGNVSAYQLKAAKWPPSAATEPSAATVSERADIDRCRNQTIEVSGRKLRLVRGEYHRHTEISGDGGNDGPLEDMWRYALDVSQMDWLGCGDHDNGAGREYTWWLTQKTTDAFRIAGKFEPPFTYERSVRYPEGHRNVMFAERGIRTLPRLPITARDQEVSAPDTQMLYKYLHQFNGICAMHTSATSMGTDWRNNDPVVEPFVEIYQGDRQNYERPGAPRCPTADNAIGGWEPKGFVNLALQKGYRLGFQCSSDHLSTHISYAHIYAEDCSRQALLKAIRERHTYGSTDNIIAEFTSKANGREYMLGDEFTSSTAPTFRIKLVGTASWDKITLVKDDVEIPLTHDSKNSVELTWTDPSPTVGKTSYYYVRGEQSDKELVWVSPMWVKYEPNSGAQ